MSEVWRIIGNGLHRVNPHGLLVGVHSIEDCNAPACVVHDPSSHHMRFWPLAWDDQWSVFWRECVHGYKHPDPDCLAYLEDNDDEWRTVHTCDGCCRPGEAGSLARVGGPGPGSATVYAGEMSSPWPPGLPSFGDCE